MRSSGRLRPEDLALPAPESAHDSMVPAYVIPSELSIRQILALLFAHLRISIPVFLGIVFLMFWVVKSLPKTYMATATLMVNLEARDPLAAQDMPLNTMGSYVATQTQLIRSPALLGKVVERLNLTKDPEYAAGFRGGDNAALAEYVEGNLGRTLQVAMGQGEQLIYISASAKNPAKAAEVANTVASMYLDDQRRRASDPAKEREAFYSEGLAELQAKLIAAQDKVADFRKKNRLSSVTATATDSEAQALADYEQQLLQAQNLRRTLEARRTGQNSTTNEVMNSNVIQGLKNQLGTLEAQLAQIGRTYGAMHPRVQELESQINAVRQSIIRETSALTQNVSTELLRARELETQYTLTVSKQREKLLQLRQLQEEGSKLNLELASAEAVYRQALDGYDRVKFASTNDKANVSFVNRATPPAASVEPKKLKLMAMGSFAALIMALAGPLLYELFFNRRIRCRDDVEREFGIPVLVEFPAVRGLQTGAA